ncbi:MAG: potassium-transporting ATPase subunit C [Terrimicrobiaceae bacterium]
MTAVTLLICVAGYTVLILGFARAVTPGAADGSLIRAADGHIVGSALIAQKFTQPRYFWPRPSAVDYNGTGAGGSNKSPTSPDLAERAEKTVGAYGATSASRSCASSPMWTWLSFDEIRRGPFPIRIDRSGSV